MNFDTFKTKYQKEKVLHFPNWVPPNPKVSVLVQTYNHEAFIGRCLDGILEQITDFEFEILLGEDFSSDQTREICKEFATKYREKIRLFLHHPLNKIKVQNHTTGNFNALYSLFSAKGEYIAFCEGDDIWTDPYKLQKQIDFHEFQDTVAFTYHTFTEVNEKLQPIPRRSTLDQPRKNIKNLDLKKLIYHPLLSTVCFKHYFKEQIPDEIIEVLNVDSFVLSILGNFGYGHFQGEINSSLYRKHSGGIWSEKSKSSKFHAKINTYSKLKNFYSKSGDKAVSEHFHHKIKMVLKNNIARTLKDGEYYVALQSFIKMLLKHY